MVQVTRQGDALTGTLDESSAVDGGLVVVTLKPSTIERYNELVATMQSEAQAAVDVDASTAAEQAAFTAAETASTKVADDMEALQKLVVAAPDLGALDTHLAAARSFLKKARSEAAAAGSENDTIAACDKVIAAGDMSIAVHDAGIAFDGVVEEVDAAATAR